jgi:hypothetical protein
MLEVLLSDAKQLLEACKNNMQKLKAQRHTLENTSEKLISIALKAGATSAEVCASYSSKTKIGLEKQDFHMVSSDDGFQFGLKVLVGDKQGFASTNSEEPKELRELAEKAVQIAELSPSNPLQTIQPTSNLPEGAPQDLWDDTLFDLSLKTQKEWTKLPRLNVLARRNLNRRHRLSHQDHHRPDPRQRQQHRSRSPSPEKQLAWTSWGRKAAAKTRKVDSSDD